MLLCTVRDCRLPLERRDRQWACGRGHSFDMARSGYLNLLQPQDRRSKNPGDTPEAVAARRRLHDLGVTQPLFEAIFQMAAVTSESVVLDAGCGEGFYLGQLVARAECEGHGIDISIPAIDAAARRYPACEWVVANADRFVPYADASFSHVFSITARHNAPEFHRVLKPGGSLLVAIPAPGDLQELRGPGRDRVPTTIAAFASHFTLRDQGRVTTQAGLDAELLEDVRHSIYRPLRAQPVFATGLTFSLDLLLFVRT